MNLKICQLFGIPLYLNLFTIPFAVFVYYSNEEGAFALAILIISLFFVVLHEYGHCFMARKYKWEVVDISILPIGGIAQIHFKYDKPYQEIAVALAGPAVNLFFTLFFIPFIFLTVYFDNYSLCFVFVVLFVSNIIILLFNLLCIFPMDGGRVLRAFLSSKIGHERATWWAVRIGQIGSFVLATMSFYYGFFLAGVISMIMCALSQNELSHAKLIASLHRIRINLAWWLNKPELKEANLPELILALESVEDEALKQRIQTEELLPLLKDLDQSSISI